MSKKHDQSLARILAAKADFLISLQANCGLFIGEHLETLKEAEARVEALPSRGARQRRNRDDEMRLVEQRMERLQIRLGRTVISSYAFVESHAGLLPAGMRKLLLGRDRK